MNRYTGLICFVVLTSLVSSHIQAADLLWTQPPPVSNNLGDANYFNNTSSTAGVAPTGSDILFIGANGNATHSTGTLSAQKLRIGNVLGAAAFQGAGTVTVNNGAKVDLTLAGGGANASLIIGGGTLNTTNSGFDGTLNIDGANSNVTSAQLAQIGFGDNANANATVNITNGGSLVTTMGNINLGERNGAGTGVPGHLNISGATSAITITVASANLNVGVRAPSTYLQSDGIVSVGGVNVGQNNAHNSSLTINGGTFATKTNGVILVGANTAQNASLNVGGTAVLNLLSNITVGDTTSSSASLNVSGTADINIPGAASAGNIFIGRGTSSGATFTMTGGTIDLGNHFLMGTASTPGATNIQGTQSGGTITTTNNFVLADSFGASTYNLSGTGAINASGLVIVGRQNAAGVMNQTGGTVTAALGVNVGNAQNGTTTLWGTGTYNVSGGTITANSVGNALSIGSQGTGTFRVTGDDATIDVNGNMLVNTVVGTSQGTLAFQLETGDLLSQIDVSGTATFNAGSILNFDTSLASPTQTTYNVLTAASFVGIDSPNDPDITFNGPAGWGFQLVSGGNGQILQFFQLAPHGLQGDFNSDGKVDAGDYVTWRKNDGTNNALANDNGLGTPVGPNHYTLWRANFGNPPGSGSGLSGATVPEPASILLVVGAVAGLAWTRRR